jgi:predicted phage tail protein
VKKVEIKLHGILGKELGRRFFSLAVSSVSEALHAINVLTSNKLNRVLNKHGCDKFNVVINGRTIRHDKILDPKDPNVYREISNSELVLKTNKLETIDIIPVIEASDSDIFAIILGVILIIVGAFTGVGPVLGTALIVGGIGIVAAGVINLLSKPPSFEAFQEIGGATKKSYLFPFLAICSDIVTYSLSFDNLGINNSASVMEYLNFPSNGMEYSKHSAISNIFPKSSVLTFGGSTFSSLGIFNFPKSNNKSSIFKATKLRGTTLLFFFKAI